MAAGAGAPDLHRAVLSCRAGAASGARSWCWCGPAALVADRRADVGRHFRAALRVAGPLGRAAGDADPRDLRARLRLSARHPRRARPPLETAGDPLALRALCRTDPRRSADQPAVHGERDVSAVHARRRQHRQTAAGADRVRAVRRRLSRRSRSRRPAGGAAGTARGRRRARPVLLEEKRPDHPAAGDPPCDPAAGEYLHRASSRIPAWC